MGWLGIEKCCLSIISATIFLDAIPSLVTTNLHEAIVSL